MRFLLAAACVCAAALPFVLVRFPPVTDLPQYVAQTRLFFETIGASDTPYRFQWYTPYLLVYVPFAAVWKLLPPLLVGRAVMVVLVGLWILTTHWLAAWRKRSCDAAVLATLVLFSPPLYWGFLSFVIGWPAFGLWLWLTTRRPDSVSIGAAIRLLAGAALLYFAHALWFAMGLVWLAVHGVACGLSRRAMAVRFLSVSPVILAAGIWYPQLATQGFSSDTFWLTTPTAKLSLDWFTLAAGNELRGPASTWIAVLVLAWIVAALWQHRRDLGDTTDRPLALAAALLGSAAIGLPYAYANTIYFAERWLPPALTLLLLALPPPSIAPGLRRLAALGAVLAISLSVLLAWMWVDQNELSGLQESLASLPDRPRVLGLDYLQESQRVNGRPFLQMFAYAQVVKGGLLNFSFAQYAPMPIVFRNKSAMPWTRGLEWFPERVRPGDFAHFDYVIISGTREVHDSDRWRTEIEPVTRAGLWRLYRVRRSEP